MGADVHPEAVVKPWGSISERRLFDDLPRWLAGSGAAFYFPAVDWNTLSLLSVDAAIGRIQPTACETRIPVGLQFRGKDFNPRLETFF